VNSKQLLCNLAALQPVS